MALVLAHGQQANEGRGVSLSTGKKILNKFLSECPVAEILKSVCYISSGGTNILDFTLYQVSKSQQISYLLHGDLWLGGHVLLGVAHTSSILVLGNGAHWGGSG